MDKPVLAIANSKAGSAHSMLDQFAEALDTYGVDYVLHTVTTPPEAEAIIDSVSKDEFSSVVSFGGDGTTAVIIKAATRKKLPVLPLRGGTGNGLARSIGVSDKLEANIQAFSTGSYVVKEFPLASVNGEPLVLDFHFGMLAKSVLSTPVGVKKWLGDKAYILNTIKQGTTDIKDSYHMKIDGNDIKLDAYACYVANITTMPFQGVNIFPKPKPGCVRVITLHSRNPATLAWWFVVKRLTGRSSNQAITRWYAQKVAFHKTPKKMIFDDHERKVDPPTRC